MFGCGGGAATAANDGVVTRSRWLAPPTFPARFASVRLHCCLQTAVYLTATRLLALPPSVLRAHTHTHFMILFIRVDNLF